MFDNAFIGPVNSLLRTSTFDFYSTRHISTSNSIKLSGRRVDLFFAWL
jgi:hypothetical protein